MTAEYKYIETVSFQSSASPSGMHNLQASGSDAVFANLGLESNSKIRHVCMDRLVPRPPRKFFSEGQGGLGTRLTSMSMDKP